MSKPKIIIVDEDEKYVVSMQNRFVKEFFDTINLEIITEKDYFNEYFSKPQSAEILIISEELYATSLQKHNINNVFVMVEQYEESQIEGQLVTKIYKYTNIKEIFNIIVGKSSVLSKMDGTVEQNTQIIVFTSAVGGIGKTTISMGVASCLAQNYKNILYLNASWLQNFEWLLGEKKLITDNELYKSLAYLDSGLVSKVKKNIEKKIFDYLPPFKASIISLGLDYRIYVEIAKLAKESSEYDFIIVDAEQTLDENKIELLDIADQIIMVTDQTPRTILATNKFVENVDISTEKCVYVCNKYYEDSQPSSVIPKYIINENISKINNANELNFENLSKNEDIRKLAFIID